MIRSCGICLEIVSQFFATVKLFGTQDSLYSRVNSMKCLASVFSKYGGLLGKIAQLLSLDTEQTNVFDDCKPAATEESISYVLNEVMHREPFVGKVEIDPFPHKSGSLGQVYKGVLTETQVPVILKVQFRGIKETFEEDFAVLDFITTYLYKSIDHFGAAISDIKEKTREELDYVNEMKNQLKIAEIMKDHPEVHVPKVYTELCTSDAIVMEEMVGFKSIPEYVKTASDEEKSALGNKILKFVMNTFYEHGIFYSDNHYGNFLVNDAHEICVLDFGCVNYFEPELLEDLKKMHTLVRDEDKDGFLSHLEKMGIMLPTTSPESREYCYKIFSLQYQPLLKPGFKFTQEWFDEMSDKDMDLMKDWGLPSGLIYLHKIPWGLYHIMNRLGVTVEENNYML